MDKSKESIGVGGACWCIHSRPEANVQLLIATKDSLFIQFEGQSWHVLTIKGDCDPELVQLI